MLTEEKLAADHHFIMCFNTVDGKQMQLFAGGSCLLVFWPQLFVARLPLPAQLAHRRCPCHVCRDATQSPPNPIRLNEGKWEIICTSVGKSSLRSSWFPHKLMWMNTSVTSSTFNFLCINECVEGYSSAKKKIVCVSNCCGAVQANQHIQTWIFFVAHL